METSFPLLSSPCDSLKSVGKRTAQVLKKLRIYTIQDLLFHLPLRYQNRTQLTSISDLTSGNDVVLVGTVTNQVQLYKPRLQLLVQITDGTGTCYIRFFYFNSQQKQQLKIGQRVLCYGEVRSGRHGLELVHPEYRIIAPGVPPILDNAYTPIYPSTEGISQTTWRRITEEALSILPTLHDMLDLIPLKIRERFDLAPLPEVLRYVHRPPPNADIIQLTEIRHPFQERLAFEELLAYQLGLRLFRKKIQQHRALPFIADEVLLTGFLKNLSFTLTNAQNKVFHEIATDLCLPQPMLRLVQGDVGSGKTVVAALAMLIAVRNGCQAAIMVPTELLAEQHYQTLQNWMQPLGIQVDYLSGKLTGKAKKTVLNAIETQTCHIIVGTHALFQKQVNFQKLGLIVVDEQHRFGVEQRLALRNKGAESDIFPHQLIMTATPIPRTLAMTAYADLDISVIDELPKGRKPVITLGVSNQRRDEVLTKVRQACGQGGQVYWVCTLIDESESLMCQAAESTAVTLQAELGHDTRIALIHGRLPSIEKEEIMTEFKRGQIDLLVSTTVIEVGVDVPNANLMVIENPERLGLAQLHQLRGRVGRGDKESFCILLYQAPLSYIAKQRLAVMRETTDGFIIAERDLLLRGPGEILGTRQTGVMQFKIADLQRDNRLCQQAHQAAKLIEAEYSVLVEPLIARWTGGDRDYGQV